jgi:hypothetical protein
MNLKVEISKNTKPESVDGQHVLDNAGIYTYAPCDFRCGSSYTLNSTDAKTRIVSLGGGKCIAFIKGNTSIDYLDASYIRRYVYYPLNESMSVTFSEA